MYKAYKYTRAITALDEAAAAAKRKKTQRTLSLWSALGQNDVKRRVNTYRKEAAAAA